VEEDDIVVNKIWARNGSVAVVPRQLAGCYVSSEFPTFSPILERLDPHWFHWLTKTEDFWKKCDEKSRGTSGKNRIRPEKFLEIDIPLPSLIEQRRIITVLGLLSLKVQETQTLRKQSENETHMLFDAYLREMFETPRLKRFLVGIADTDLRLNAETCDPGRAFPNGEFTYVDISSVGIGPSVITKGKLLPSHEAPSRARRVIHTNDVIFSTVRPNLRAVAKVGQELDNQICSTGFAVFSCGDSISPDFLLLQLYSPFFIDQCVSRTTGGHYPAINESNLSTVSISVPPVSEQRVIVSKLLNLKAKLDETIELQSKTSMEIDALLPLAIEKAFRGEV